MISISNVSKSFDKKLVLDHVSCDIPTGSIFGLIGINGAGKSTLLRMMTGIYQLDSGSIKFDDHDVYDESHIKKDIFFLPDDPYYFKKMNGIEVKEIFKVMYDFNEQKFLQFIDVFNLDIKEPLYKYSKGMRRRFFISLAFAISPKYLILDEAFDGLDPKARLLFKRELVNLKMEKESTIVIASHSLRELEDICDSYGLLDGHHMRFAGNLIDDVSNMKQYQIAFKDEFDQSRFKDFNVLKYTQIKSVAQIIIKGQSEEVKKQLEALNPIFIEEINLNFESLFLLSVEGDEANV